LESSANPLTPKQFDFKSPQDNLQDFRTGVVNIMEHTRSPSRSISGVFDQKDLDLFKTIMNRSVYREHAKNFLPSQEDRKIIKNIMTPIIDHYIDVPWKYEFQFVIYNWHGDGDGKDQKIHCDGYLPDSKVFKNFLVPIETSFTTNTITFETYSIRSTKIITEKKGEWRSTYPVYYKYQSQMNFYNYEPDFIDDYYIDLFSEDNKKCCIGHRVEKLIPYTVGDVIMFDSLRFHTPSVIPSGQYKKGMIISVSEV